MLVKGAGTGLLSHDVSNYDVEEITTASDFRNDIDIYSTHSETNTGNTHQSQCNLQDDDGSANCTVVMACASSPSSDSIEEHEITFDSTPAASEEMNSFGQYEDQMFPVVQDDATIHHLDHALNVDAIPSSKVSSSPAKLLVKELFDCIQDHCAQQLRQLESHYIDQRQTIIWHSTQLSQNVMQSLHKYDHEKDPVPSSDDPLPLHSKIQQSHVPIKTSLFSDVAQPQQTKCMSCMNTSKAIPIRKGLSDDFNKPKATVKRCMSSKNHVPKAEMNPINDCHCKLISNDLVAIQYLFHQSVLDLDKCRTECRVLHSQMKEVTTQNRLLQKTIDELQDRHSKDQSAAVDMQTMIDELQKQLCKSQANLNLAKEENKQTQLACHRSIMHIQAVADRDTSAAHEAELQARADRITAERMLRVYDRNDVPPISEDVMNIYYAQQCQLESLKSEFTQIMTIALDVSR
jgi:hypothetical protein